MLSLLIGMLGVAEIAVGCRLEGDLFLLRQSREIRLEDRWRGLPQPIFQAIIDRQDVFFRIATAPLLARRFSVDSPSFGFWNIVESEDGEGRMIREALLRLIHSDPSRNMDILSPAGQVKFMVEQVIARQCLPRSIVNLAMTAAYSAYHAEHRACPYIEAILRRRWPFDSPRFDDRMLEKLLDFIWTNDRHRYRGILAGSSPYHGVLGNVEKCQLDRVLYRHFVEQGHRLEQHPMPLRASSRMMSVEGITELIRALQEAGKSLLPLIEFVRSRGFNLLRSQTVQVLLEGHPAVLVPVFQDFLRVDRKDPELDLIRDICIPSGAMTFEQQAMTALGGFCGDPAKIRSVLRLLPQRFFDRLLRGALQGCHLPVLRLLLSVKSLLTNSRTLLLLTIAEQNRKARKVELSLIKTLLVDHFQVAIYCRALQEGRFGTGVSERLRKICMELDPDLEGAAAANLDFGQLPEDLQRSILLGHSHYTCRVFVVPLLSSYYAQNGGLFNALQQEPALLAWFYSDYRLGRDPLFGAVSFRLVKCRFFLEFVLTRRMPGLQGSWLSAANLRGVLSERGSLYQAGVPWTRDKLTGLCSFWRERKAIAELDMLKSLLAVLETVDTTCRAFAMVQSATILAYAEDTPTAAVLCAAHAILKQRGVDFGGIFERLLTERQQLVKELTTDYVKNWGISSAWAWNRAPELLPVITKHAKRLEGQIWPFLFGQDLIGSLADMLSLGTISQEEVPANLFIDCLERAIVSNDRFLARRLLTTIQDPSLAWYWEETEKTLRRVVCGDRTTAGGLGWQIAIRLLLFHRRPPMVAEPAPSNLLFGDEHA